MVIEACFATIFIMKRLFYSALLLILIFFLSFRASSTYAADFSVDYSIAYTVVENGTTNVTQQVSLTNKQTNLYAQQYAIIIDSSQISNVTAFDSKGSIRPQIQQKDTKTEIILSFNDAVVGIGKTLNFTLSYQDDNIAKKNGTIWEINIPGIAEDQDLGNYTITLKVPQSFGPPAYLVPEPTKGYTWTKEQLLQGGVSGAFGEKQVFELSLSYFLENTKNQTIITEIALPPSTAFQQVILQSIDPQPLEVVTDEDNNWLARYKLPPESSQQITANVLTELFLTPRDVAYPLDPSEEQQFLQQTPYWQVNNATIQSLAQQLKTPKAIYDYVVQTLSYDYDRINQQITRKGAIQALKTPNHSVCMEFTDTFIAIARAAGIPARQAVGYGYTTNPKLRPLSLVSDVLHAWPEYYDREKQIWIPIDPTWANTTGGVDYFNKLDFNHIVFAYNGIRDDYPYPVGFYRKEGRTGKDVEIQFRNAVPNSEVSNVQIQFDTSKRIPAGFTSYGTLDIKNKDRIAAEGVAVTIDSPTLGIYIEKKLPVVPPYGHLKIPFSFKTKDYLILDKGTIRATVNGTTYTHTVDITPAYHIVAPVFIIGIWIIITILIVVRKIFLWKLHKK